MTDSEKISLIQSIVDDVIKVQSMKKQLAEKRNNDDDWLKAHDMINLCETIQDVIDETIDLEL